ncbi:MAG: Radical protein [Phycisphaerales bacterium]|nr:Radical protein [Phycisphaerales bacterium]
MPNSVANSLPLVQVPTPEHLAPRVYVESLDHLWFQLTGTLCNLTCTHCFISCSPSNHSFGFLDYDKVLAALEDSRRLGVKEYYFTGGEPFMHPRVLDILEQTLAIGPATVLSNGTLFREKTVERLVRIRDASIYSLELRVSIDGPDAASNDKIRGEGAFDRAMEGARRIVEAGFLPIITMAQTWDDAEAQNVYQRMRKVLIDLGYTRPRVKLLPSLKIGAEALRDRGYRDEERISHEMMEGYDASQLICAYSRVVTDRGVHVCPILIEQPDSLLDQSLEGAMKKDYPLRHQACYTCWLHGAICSNASSVADVKESARAGNG